MKVWMSMAGLLHAVCGLETGGVGSVESASREAHLQHLELFSEEKLRSELDSMFENNRILDAREILQREEVYLRILGGKLGGAYFAMAGMVLTDGIWHSRYARVFERAKIDFARDEEMLKRLMNEMVVGEIWKVVNEKLREDRNDARKVMSGDVETSETGRCLLQADRRWRKVLEDLLKKDGLLTRVVEGKYDEELKKMISKDEELVYVLYGYMLKSESTLGKNEGLAREAIVNAVERGHWLYVDELDEFVGAKRMRSLFSEDDAFEKIRERYSLEGEMSIGRLKEIAREGKLDELVESVVRELVRYGKVHDLKRLMQNVDGRVFDGLVRKGELDVAFKEGIKRLIMDGKAYDLWMLTSVGAVKARGFDGLVLGGELDGILREGMERLIRDGEVYRLKMLVETVEGRVFDGLVSSGELDTVLKEGIDNLVRDGEMYELCMLMGIEVVKGRMSSGLLKTALSEGMKSLVINGRIDDLKTLIETEEGRGVFGELVRRGGLNAVIREGIENMVKGGRIDNLRWLIDTAGGEVFDGLVSSGELDAVLEEGIKKLIMDGEIYDLWMLVLIETVKTMVFDGLVLRGELDATLSRGIRKLIMDGEIGNLKTLMGIDVVKTRVSDVFIRRRELDPALKEGLKRLIRSEKIHDLRMLMGIEVVRARVSDGLVPKGELDAAFDKMAKNMIKRSKDRAGELKKAVEEGLFNGLVSARKLRKAKGGCVIV